MNQQTTSQTTPFPAMQRFINEWLEQMCRPHSAYILFEVDVTEVRPAIRAFRARTGSPLGFTAVLTACWARAIAEHKLLHAYRMGRSELVLFDDVDVTIPVEREVEDQKIPVNVIVRAANRKSLAEIDHEIRTAKTGENPQFRAIRWAPIFFLVPAFFRRFIWKRLLASPYRQQRINGTTIVTNAGMFGSGTGWGLFPSPYTASLLVGSIARKPGVVDGKIAVREYLCLTLIVDHDIVDGAVAARFTQRLREHIEHPDLLDQAGVRTAANRDGPRGTSAPPHERKERTQSTITSARMQWFLNHLANPAVRLLLRSPAHRLLSNRLLLITYRGRRSGRWYTTPVGYVQAESGIYVVAGGHEHKTWWRNIRGGAPVQLRLKGRDVAATADVLNANSSPDEVLEALRLYFARQPGAARSLGGRVAVGGTSEPQDLRASANDLLLIRLTPTVGSSERKPHVGIVDQPVAASGPALQGGAVMAPSVKGEARPTPSATVPPTTSAHLESNETKEQDCATERRASSSVT